MKDVYQLAVEIRKLTTLIDCNLDLSVSGQRGSKAAVKRVRKYSKQLERAMLDFRKRSVKEIG
jgi:hypothetical protein